MSGFQKWLPPGVLGALLLWWGTGCRAVWTWRRWRRAMPSCGWAAPRMMPFGGGARAQEESGVKYNGFYFALFRGTMQKTLAEHYGKGYARDVMGKARRLYRTLVAGAPDIGDGNPMAYNELFALAFVAPYLASRKHIPPELVREMMRRSLYRVKFYFSVVDLNTPRGKRSHQRSILKYMQWYTPERERRYPASFRVDFEGRPYEGACYYRITRCPICAYCERLGVGELMPLLCQLDEVMVGLQHGVLHRRHTIAAGGPYCDYWITGDREETGGRAGGI